MTNPVIVFAQFVTTMVFSYKRNAKRREKANIFRGESLFITRPVRHSIARSLSQSVTQSLVTQVIEVLHSRSILTTNAILMV